MLVIAAVALFLWLRSSDVFAVKRITATATARVSLQEISEATSQALGVSLLRLSTGAIEDALLALPYVRSVEVYRSFPNTLEVTLVEYEPVARLQAGNGDIWLVTADGRALEGAQPSEGAGLPLVIPASPVSLVAGEQVPKLIVDALPVVGLLESEGIVGRLPGVEQIRVSAAGGVVLTLEGGAELRLGDATQLEQKLKVAAGRIESYLRDGKQVEYVDVSVPDHAAVKAK
ncbi:MAG: hypothetical protein A2133_04505 [Actinobacteria bacterium RBG_16_64_13]|nr:MAG: hypothetical protein A2133_04505 [Actinobacteria bacterium RBG_16_64_13]